MWDNYVDLINNANPRRSQSKKTPSSIDWRAYTSETSLRADLEDTRENAKRAQEVGQELNATLNQAPYEALGQKRSFDTSLENNVSSASGYSKKRGYRNVIFANTLVGLKNEIHGPLDASTKDLLERCSTSAQAIMDKFSDDINEKMNKDPDYKMPTRARRAFEYYNALKKTGNLNFRLYNVGSESSDIVNPNMVATYMLAFEQLNKEQTKTPSQMQEETGAVLQNGSVQGMYASQTSTMLTKAHFNRRLRKTNFLIADGGGGHIKRVVYCISKSIMEVTFEKESKGGNVCVFFGVPNKVAYSICDALEKDTIVTYTPLRRDSKVREKHLAGILFWDYIRFRTTTRETRYPYTHIGLTVPVDGESPKERNTPDEHGMVDATDLNTYMDKSYQNVQFYRNNAPEGFEDFVDANMDENGEEFAKKFVKQMPAATIENLRNQYANRSITTIISNIADKLQYIAKTAMDSIAAVSDDLKYAIDDFNSYVDDKDGFQKFLANNNLALVLWD